jgi:hypothetical protein
MLISFPWSRKGRCGTDTKCVFVRCWVRIRPGHRFRFSLCYSMVPNKLEDGTSIRLRLLSSELFLLNHFSSSYSAFYTIVTSWNKSLRQSSSHIFFDVSEISDSFFSQPVYKFWKAFSSLLTSINDSMFIWTLCLKPLKIQTSSESGNNRDVPHSDVLFNDVYSFSYTASVMYGWTNEVWIEALVDWCWFGKTGVLGGKTMPVMFHLPHRTRTGLGLNVDLRRERGGRITNSLKRRTTMYCVDNSNYENNQQDELYGIIHYSKSALHVSGDVFAHYQEHLTVFTVSGSVHPICYRLLYRMSWNWTM